MTAPDGVGALAAEQARALSGPSRRAIVAYLADAAGPVDVAELTAHLGLNHNAVRKHLAQLVDARLVVEARQAPTGPGRPRLLYRLDPAGPPGAEASYERLAVMLATALATGEDIAEVGRRAASASLAAVSGAGAVGRAAPLDALAARFEADGFEPTVQRRGRRTEIVLGCCPFAAAAEANPEAVCRLHLGLSQGAAEAIGGLEVDGLAPKDPRRAGCRLAVRETV